VSVARLGLLLLLVFLVGPAYAQPSDVKQRHAYDSRYLVFGARDATGTPRLLAIDLNRTRRHANHVTYEYKPFTATGGDWTLHLYDQWDVDPDTVDRFPARKGLRPLVMDDGRLQIEATLADLSLQVRMAPLTFAFTTEGSRFGTIRTAHPRSTITWNGTTYERRGVYEWVRGTGRSQTGTDEEQAEARRQIDDNATFGQYNWLVLYDESGRLWHVSQGALTQDLPTSRRSTSGRALRATCSCAGSSTCRPGRCACGSVQWASIGAMAPIRPTARAPSTCSGPWRASASFSESSRRCLAS